MPTRPSLRSAAATAVCLAAALALAPPVAGQEATGGDEGLQRASAQVGALQAILEVLDGKIEALGRGLSLAEEAVVLMDDLPVLIVSDQAEAMYDQVLGPALSRAGQSNALLDDLAADAGAVKDADLAPLLEAARWINDPVEDRLVFASELFGIFTQAEVEQRPRLRALLRDYYVVRREVSLKMAAAVTEMNAIANPEPADAASGDAAAGAETAACPDPQDAAQLQGPCWAWRPNWKACGLSALRTDSYVDSVLWIAAPGDDGLYCGYQAHLEEWTWEMLTKADRLGDVDGEFYRRGEWDEASGAPAWSWSVEITERAEDGTWLEGHATQEETWSKVWTTVTPLR